MHIRSLYLTMLWLTLSFTLFAQRENKYLERALPQSWQENDTIFQQTLPVDDQWWTKFNDPILDSIIAVAIKQNYNALIAIDRIAAAKASLRQAQAAYSPTIGLSAGWLREQTSGHITSTPQYTTQYTDGSLTMSWEIDVFGRIRNNVKAEKETYKATQEDYYATMVSLCASVATAYFNLRGSQQQLEVNLNNCKSQLATVQITEKRFETGLASKLDVAQALSSYYSTKSSIPSIEASIIQYTNSLAVLMGLYPEEVRELLYTHTQLPEYIEPVGIGIPANLLLRRPDIRAAERQVYAEAASLGATRADYWPQIYVQGNIGFSAHDFNKLANHKSMTYEIAPTLTWTLFEGTKRIQATKQAKAVLDESIRQFNYDVLNAVQEADNAMCAYKNSIKQLVALREVVNQGRQTFELSLDLYKQGLSPFQNVLDSQRSLLTYENQLTEAKASSLIYLVQLYQALGGGWSENLDDY